MTLFVDIDREGRVFAVAVRKGAKPPKSVNIVSGLDGDLNPTIANATLKTELNENFQVKPLRLKLDGLKGGEPYDIYYVAAIDIPGEMRIGSIVMKVSGTPLEV